MKRLIYTALLLVFALIMIVKSQVGSRSSNSLMEAPGINLMDAPSVKNDRGQIEITREFILPSEYDPPDIPEEFLKK